MLKITKGGILTKPNNLSSRLRHLDIRIFHFVFEGNHDLDGTAIYFPEKDFIFRRVSVLQNLCPALARNDYTPISVEVSLNDELNNIPQDKIQRTVIDHLQKLDQFKALGEPVEILTQDIPHAYPLPLVGVDNAIKRVHNYYNTHGVYLCGRGGNHDYCNCDVAYKQGKETVLSIF